MSVLVARRTRLLVQGITGHQGTFHARAMREYGTRVVAGTSPGKGGTEVEGVPVYDTVRDAVKGKRPNTSILFVPAPYAKDAVIEAIEAGLPPPAVGPAPHPLHHPP